MLNSPENITMMMMVIVVVLLICRFFNVCDSVRSHRDVSRGPGGRDCGGDQVVCGDNHWSHQFVPLTLSTAHQSAAAQGEDALGCSTQINSTAGKGGVLLICCYLTKFMFKLPPKS